MVKTNNIFDVDGFSDTKRLSQRGILRSLPFVFAACGCMFFHVKYHWQLCDEFTQAAFILLGVIVGPKGPLSFSLVDATYGRVLGTAARFTAGFFNFGLAYACCCYANSFVVQIYR